MPNIITNPRIIWIVIFFFGTAVISWFEWRADEFSEIAWFLMTGIWSAVTGIGYSVHDQFTQPKTDFDTSQDE